MGGTGTTRVLPALEMTCLAEENLVLRFVPIMFALLSCGVNAGDVIAYVSGEFASQEEVIRIVPARILYYWRSPAVPAACIADLQHPDPQSPSRLQRGASGGGKLDITSTQDDYPGSLNRQPDGTYRWRYAWHNTSSEQGEIADCLYFRKDGLVLEEVELDASGGETADVPADGVVEIINVSQPETLKDPHCIALIDFLKEQTKSEDQKLIAGLRRRVKDKGTVVFTSMLIAVTGKDSGWTVWHVRQLPGKPPQAVIIRSRDEVLKLAPASTAKSMREICFITYSGRKHLQQTAGGGNERRPMRTSLDELSKTGYALPLTENQNAPKDD
jgi:hypothetical protein